MNLFGNKVDADVIRLYKSNTYTVSISGRNAKRKERERRKEREIMGNNLACPKGGKYSCKKTEWKSQEKAGGTKKTYMIIISV
jgi:hypothetical protein